jgi:hypothetical protein
MVACDGGFTPVAPVIGRDKSSRITTPTAIKRLMLFTAGLLICLHEHEKPHNMPQKQQSGIVHFPTKLGIFQESPSYL